MNLIQIIGAFIIIVIISFVGVYSGKVVSSASDYTSAGGKGSALLVVGIALATLIGGATTVGTTQTAFNYGVAGMWYTLGAAVAFILMAIFIVPVIRKSNKMTMGGIISGEFGDKAELIASTVLYVSMVLSLASQMVSSCAVLKSMIPSLDGNIALILSFALTIICVLYGGNLSAGKAGELKTLLIMMTVIGCGIFILTIGGVVDMNVTLEKGYFNLFTRGAGFEIGNGIATALGVCCSQANMNAVLAARNQSTARKGMTICAITMPFIGLGSTMIGMYMKAVEPTVASASAFSTFLVDHVPGILSGMAVGTLFITLILSAAGTALGCSTVLVKSVIKKATNKLNDPKKELFNLRAAMLITLIIATLAGSGIFGDSVLGFAFLSMSLRCVTLIIPFILAVYFKDKADKKWIIVGEILGPLSVIFFGITKILPIDELYIGLIVSFVCAIIAFISKKTKSA